MPTLEEIKTCCYCKKNLPITSFNKNRATKDGLSACCRQCKSLKEKEYRAKNPQKYDEIKKRWKEKNKEFYSEWIFKHRHGISRQDVLDMLEKQGGGCLICGKKEPGAKGYWHLDHNHNCCPQSKSCDNCRRGVLCNNCNLMLGLVQDNKNILSKAIEYLDRFEWRKDANV